MTAVIVMLNRMHPEWFRQTDCALDIVFSVHAVHLRSIHCVVFSSGIVFIVFIVFLRSTSYFFVFLRIPSYSFVSLRISSYPVNF
jgi:hypothetical protein